jgi:Cys-tRNA(Pro)/Cys-tRNA(Cys) deacylase
VRGALDVHRELLARDVPHEVVRLPVRLASADDLPAVLGLEHGCVTVRCYLVERSGRCSFAAVLVPAGAVPFPEALLDALSARTVRPARPEQVNATTDYAAGLVCPVGLPPEVEVLADEALAQSSTCYTALGEGGVALGIRTPDLLEVVGARTAALTGAVAADRPHRSIELDPPRSVRPAP